MLKSVNCATNLIKYSLILKRSVHISSSKQKSFTKWYRNLWIPKSVEPPYTHVTQIGDPVLRQKAEDVPKEFVTSGEIQFLIEKMTEVLGKYGCVGLAAPQIGIPLRVIIMEFKPKLRDQFSASIYKARQMEILPLTVFINPAMKVTNFNKISFTESCDSVKGYSGVVERFEQVQVSGLTVTGEKQTLDFKGWNARIAQHEMDHLDGRIYTDIMDKSTFECTCWQAVNAREGRVEIPFCPK